ncbi:MAG: hypothetical protein A3J65_01185 [Candidatus Buchananbacteria bacterium RIFCSPHIGHO2_02_FULL_45_11b]|uniref:Uncharacterized protein n=4 Tax=Candidatus Buchananiibacteriota TaxID=1817903 RepID=A0A1G1YNE3_9BACT|nr:MAG: hypothetical protein A2663_03095 [Candidatus Buchananbacteria bacterium RIFCSPHIGHO2_01_FULL_46_12]OGY51459.1 MAG: hypothetical protein A3J65_01185 [Candidatus Buchananbacteria bacterium RIFCSPHIGHO2_02_FULL_45_11b]OGY53824.1 MAG: hypothetical protein A3B15_00845 [Candidatus Buchananbacteria bacterium RIFCSPLOWO2_01_FULL_45_31]OGY58042.1 MAG: hypothetical protein A3H67_01065 [Candidatus Buchananbacteria bacterium RIFCSPLOWO2_02_FULL_46_11b]
MTLINLEEKIAAPAPAASKPRIEAEPAAPKVKKHHFKRNCCFLVLLLFIFSLTLAAAAVAKTGIFEIPVFSSVFYRLPKPKREIKIENQASAGGQNLNFSLNTETKKITLELSEEDLTFLLRQALTRANDPYFAQNLQALIFGGEVELSGLLLKPLKVNLTLKLKPLLADSRLDFKLTKIIVGSLPIPAEYGNMTVHRLLQKPLEQLNSAMVKFQLESLELSEKKAQVIFGSESLMLLQNNFNF